MQATQKKPLVDVQVRMRKADRIAQAKLMSSTKDRASIAVSELSQRSRQQVLDEMESLIVHRKCDGTLNLNRSVMLAIAKLAGIVDPDLKKFPHFPAGLDAWNVTIDLLDSLQPNWRKELPVSKSK